jgi:hypothetical protein
MGMGVAAIAVAAIGAYSSSQSSQASSDAALEAGRTSEAIADKQIKLLRQMYEQNRADMLPFLKAGQDALKKLDSVDVTGGAEEYLNNLMNLTFPDGVDPTGGAQKYIDELSQLEFELDTNDPIYQWRAAENERQVNQFMASRGGYDSRAAANILLSSGMQLQTEETERQFNQRYLAKYNQLTDLANMSYQQGQAQYKQATDKYSADVSKNITGYNAALQLGQAEYNKLLDLVKVGTGASSAAGNYGQNTANQISNVMGQNSTNQQNAILQSGAAQSAAWQGYGQSANNALMMYYMSQN